MFINTIVTVSLVGFLLFLLIYFSGVIRYIPNDRLGVLEKLWSFEGSVQSGLIALNGEAGFQPEVVRGGFHFFMPFQFRLHAVPLVTVPQGQIGYVFARDGNALPPSQTLAGNDGNVDFQDVRAFLIGGGQKGPQRKILREGTYAFNLANFVVLTRDRQFAITMEKTDLQLFDDMAATIEARRGFEPVIIKDADDCIGIVTIHDGPALPQGEIIAPAVGNDPTRAATYHNNFQEPDKFIHAAGFRGRQYQVLVDGSYYLNRLFATVELVKKTIIEVGTVGVVVSYTGRSSVDISGDSYRHGELVEPGSRGVWNKPLLPGKYAFNTYAGKVIIVPTTNFVLKWTKEAVGTHRLDENLFEVALITRDAFEPSLPLSVVVHIDYMKAPLVVQRFGDIKRLVEQTLDPMVSAYFKNIAQTKTLIELLQERSEIQQHSGDEMRAKFANYSLELQEVLIGTPRAQINAAGVADGSIEQILIQLRERQIAVEKVETYRLQEAAALQERTLREQQAIAAQQSNITASVLSIQIRENEGKAVLAQAKQQAETIQVTAKATADRVRIEGQGDADRIRAIGLADADKIRATGLAQAEATAKQVEAFGGPEYQLNSQVLMRFAQAIENGKLPLVPSIVIGGDGKSSSGSMVEAMMAMMLAQKALPDKVPAIVS